MYLMKLLITGLQNPEKAKNFKEAIMGIEGVSKVEIKPPNDVGIYYNPTKVYPGRIKAAISSVGISLPGGG
ncbi:MAG: hypothetical protein GX325_03235 [Peptococcaceae bacterium]|nr:hypothetical protein [Peptococcaceae bacterium]